MAQRLTQAVDIPRTPTKAHYISGGWAMNLNDGEEPGGDWHRSCWFAPREMRPAGPELFEGATVKVLGDEGIYDCRAALRRERHPQGWRLEPIWAARYARVCVDLVSKNIELAESLGTIDEQWWALDPTVYDLAGWLFSKESRDQVFTMCQQMAERDEAHAALWTAWKERRRSELNAYCGRH